MSDYAIGDIQGCYNSFKLLLEKIKFDKNQDTLWLAGDIINRGPDSDKMLNWAYENQNHIKLVLGNHDLHAIAVYYNIRKQSKSDTLDKLFNNKNSDKWISWLRTNPLMQYEKINNNKYIMIHAGIPPQIKLDDLIKHLKNLENKINSDQKTAIQTLSYIFNNQEKYNTQNKQELDIYLINALTRMRLCDQNGNLDLIYKGPDIKKDNKFQAWFLWDKDPSYNNIKFIFGHWAALSDNPNYQNIINQKTYFPLDTGCVWGKNLTAMSLLDNKFYTLKI